MRPVLVPSATRWTASAAPPIATRSLISGLMTPRAASAVSSWWQARTAAGSLVLYRPQWSPTIE